MNGKEDQKSEHKIVELTESIDKMEIKSEPDEISEVIDVMKTPRSYSGFELAFNIFGRKYYKVPLRLINDEIRVLDKNMKEIQYDIRTISVEPYDINIKTYYNENNRGDLLEKSSQMIALVCVKYEHYCNFSAKPKNTFISCLAEQDPVHINCVEINVVKKLIRNGKIIRETAMF